MATHTAMAQGNDASMRLSLERSLGIYHFATAKKHGWSGQSRTRYTDFQVNEITKGGEVVHLSDFFNNHHDLARAASHGIPTVLPSTSKPSQAKSPAGDGSTSAKHQAPKAEQKISAGVEQTSNGTINESDMTILVDLVGQTTADELIAFNTKIRENPKANPKSHGKVSIPAIADKTQRLRVHEEIRRIFGGKIETLTGSDGYIGATATRGGDRGQRGGGWGHRGGGRGGGRGGRNDRQGPSQHDVGPYLHFSLYKENKDTMDALNHMAKAIRVHPKAFGAAGTKDRRAVTVQRVSIKGRSPAALISINERINSIKIGDFQYAQEPIRLNDHDGNEFVIVLKNCVFSGTENLSFEEKLKVASSTVNDAVQQVIQHGFINYYGTQRFGTHQIGTHEVGMKILKEDFASAIQALLAYDHRLLRIFQNDGAYRDDINRARACSKFLDAGSAEAALECLPPRCHVERTVIRHLGKNRGDYVGALTSINRSMRTMYGHAYQSFVWNFAASKRWELFGAQVVKGDLVLVESKSITMQNTDDGEEDIEASMGLGEDVVAHQQRGLVAHVVTEDDVRAKKYTIYDVVLPSPGWDVTYPANEIGDFYVEFMGKPENGGLDPHNMRRRQRDFSLPGSYRSLMAKLKRIPTATVQAYTNDLEQLVPTDLDLIRSRKAKEAAEQDAEHAAAISSWKAFAQNVQKNEREEAKARMARRQAEPQPAPVFIIRDTWIQTSLDGSNKRIKIAKHQSDIEPAGFSSSTEQAATKVDVSAPGDNAQDETKSAKVGADEDKMEMEAKPNTASAETSSNGAPREGSPLTATVDEVEPTEKVATPITPVDSTEKVATPITPVEPTEKVATPITPVDSMEPQKIAVILRFALDTSQYATILLRELQGTPIPETVIAKAPDGPSVSVE